MRPPAYATQPTRPRALRTATKPKPTAPPQTITKLEREPSKLARHRCHFFLLCLGSRAKCCSFSPRWILLWARHFCLSYFEPADLPDSPHVFLIRHLPLATHHPPPAAQHPPTHCHLAGKKGNRMAPFLQLLNPSLKVSLIFLIFLIYASSRS